MLSLNCILVGIDLGSTACDNKGNVGNYLSYRERSFIMEGQKQFRGHFKELEDE